MKKLVLSLVALSVIVSLASAKSSLNGYFVGAQTGVMHEFFGEAANTHAIFGIKGGYDFGKYRVYGEINHNFEAKIQEIKTYGGKITTKMSSNEFIGGVDYYLQKIDNIRLFVGAFAGFENREVRTDYSGRGGSYSGPGSTDTSFMLGAKFGGIYPINRNGDLEFGARLDKPFISGSEFSDIKLAAFVGYTYKF